VARTKTDEGMLAAIERGLRIEKDGTVIGLKGKPIKGSLMIRSKKDKSNRRYLYTGFKERAVIYFHRLQAYTKYGDALFEDGVCTRHGEGGHLDNSWDNITIGTHTANMRDIPVKERRFSKTIKISDDQVRDILKLSAQGLSYGKLGKRYGVSRFTIRGYVKRRERAYCGEKDDE